MGHLRSIIFAIILFISWAVASIPVADSVSFEFQDSSTKMESLAENPAILLPLHAAALICGIDFQWDPALGEMLLSKDDLEARLVLGNRHVLVRSGRTGASSSLQPLSAPPVILDGAVALSPQDTVCVLSRLIPDMGVSWDETKSSIEVKRREPNASIGLQTGLEPNESNGEFKLKTIIIDPGHGGHDPGAVRSGILEKDIVLDISLRLANLIRSGSDWNVIMTRDSDRFITLRRRTEIADQYPSTSTLFISIHCNSHRSSSGHGLETYVFNPEATDAEAAALAKRENAEEKLDLQYILNHCHHVGSEPYTLEFAGEVQTSLIDRLKLRSRGVRRAPFYVLAGTKMPAILLEVAFVSNYYDRKKLQSPSFRQSVAEGLFESIKDFNESATSSIARGNSR